MFRALLCPSSGAHDYSVDYHMGHPVLGFLLVGSWVQAGWISVRAAGYSTTGPFMQCGGGPIRLSRPQGHSAIGRILCQ